MDQGNAPGPNVDQGISSLTSPAGGADYIAVTSVVISAKVVRGGIEEDLGIISEWHRDGTGSK